ncbi:hypothetical protein DSAG12_02487 [Promethearchaeum syntrophicum]|uniref:Uncharacterized protein n=1 Tax=Promethearchaeum syntrophicum TaxID=2594042 RepID=A0A5B9DCP4_9ARCH|nr:hypothetical protein [Candidatus Prometheoarchaeum syntrophicum]QEE16657.1 hypothetical protein DSAG12_02487 [Candidatus Prometheoarchaeum syntrophicum]
MKAQTIEGRKFLECLENSLSPFEKFVAKPDIEENLTLVGNRRYLLKEFMKILNENKTKRIIPLLADTGTGKTFFLHQIKQSLEINAPSIFIDVPPNSDIFYYDIYTKVIEMVESSVLQKITRSLADLWGAHEMKYGIFRTGNTLKVLDQAKKTSTFKNCEHQPQLEEVMIVIISHAIDPERSPIAERWLLGDIMDIDELFFLGVENNLSAKFMAEELLHLLSDHLEDGINIMFDDIDKNWQRYSKFDNSDDDFYDEFDDTYQTLTVVDEEENVPNFFEQIVKLLERNKKIKIIISMQTENKDELLSNFPEESQYLINEPIKIANYSTKDAKEYYFEALNLYRKSHGLSPIPNDEFFPLTEKLILLVYEYTLGNPREIIRNFQQIFDEIIFDDTPIEQLEKKYEEKLRK